MCTGVGEGLSNEGMILEDIIFINAVLCTDRTELRTMNTVGFESTFLTWSAANLGTEVQVTLGSDPQHLPSTVSVDIG